MIEMVQQWLSGIIAAALILSVLYAMLPAGKLRKVGKLAGSLILLLVVLRPLSRIQNVWDTSYETYDHQIQQQIEALKQKNENEMESIIAQRAAAYISDKGEQFGVHCHPTVTTRWEDGVPYPDAVTMDISFRQELSDVIAADLEIPESRQIWQGR